VKDHSKVEKSIIGWDTQIGAWARVEGSSVLGKDVQVKVRPLAGGAGRGGWSFSVLRGSWQRVSMGGRQASTPAPQRAAPAPLPQDELILHGATVLPHKEIKESVLQPKIIL
jgi:hypothetical protein